MSRWVMLASALGFGAWWGLSVLLHGAFFGLVYVATPPVEEKPSDASEFTMRISPDRVREVVAEIRQEESGRFKERVAELLKIKEELDRLNAEKIAQYNEIIKGEGVRAREDLPAVFDQVIIAQKEALAAQESAQKALASFTAAHAQAAVSATPEAAQAAQAQADAALQTALTAQQNAGNAQQQAGIIQAEIGEQLRLASDSATALSAQQSAANAQGEAGSTQGAVTGIIRQISAARQALTAAEEAAARQQAALTQVESQTTTAETALEAKQVTLASARQSVEAARTESAASAEAVKVAAASEKKRLTEPAKQAAAALKKEQAALAKAEQDVRQCQAVVKRLQDSTARQRQKTDEALAVVQKRRDILDETVATAVKGSVDLQRGSIAVQQTSLALQQAANAAITKAIAESHKDSSAVAATPSVVPTADLAGARTLADYFKQAQDAEVAVAETFKNVRAAELAALRKIPLSEALAMTKVATPDRPELNTAILGKDIASVAGVREQEKAIGAASEQMASMVALAQRMRELAAGAGANLSVAEIQAQSSRNERMEQLASEDAGAKAKDLSGEMAAAHGAHQAGGVHGVAGGDGAGMTAGAGNRPGAEGYGTPGAPPAVLGIPVKNYKPLHGRTVRAGRVAVEPGRNPEWLYVDTWHLIGPWPNPGRKNLNTKFPPETVVNLDAVYQGGRKNEAPMPVRWEFFQMPSKVAGKERTPVVPMIMPPGMGDYEIYYGYTELWFDEAADLWVAIGSDDQSKVWINDLLVWKSGDAHKSWVANEGLRKVHFRKGINRVLYRLENGQNSGGFSFIVCLAADQATGG